MGSYKAKQMANSKAAKAKQLQKKGKDEEPPVKAKQQPPEPPRDARAAARKRGAPEPEGERPYQPETSELEKKRLGVADELRKVEQQIFDLETKYLEQSSAFGNAVRGYEGFLGGVAQGNRKVVIKTDERLFSLSSASAPQSA